MTLAGTWGAVAWTELGMLKWRESQHFFMWFCFCSKWVKNETEDQERHPIKCMYLYASSNCMDNKEGLVPEQMGKQ